MYPHGQLVKNDVSCAGQPFNVSLVINQFNEQINLVCWITIQLFLSRCLYRFNVKKRNVWGAIGIKRGLLGQKERIKFGKFHIVTK
ncbi:hypothetical protein SEH50133_07213 [Salmonella enterica subsp. houtenae serovar 50:g,z51:- str. 01-0133]|nr:hypothetical protein SEH50133_07213 [Salmonella enterica subsp. houtenae serovar 50:g,z51:- str. 01-0133]